MKNFISLFTLLLLPIIANQAYGVTIGSSAVGNPHAQIHAFHPIGQTFRAEGTTLESLSFHYAESNDHLPNVAITLSIYAGIGNGGALIGFSQFSLDGTFDGLHAVNFSALGSVFTIGDQYSAMVTTTNAYWGITFSNNGYADGTAISFGDEGTTDLRFSATFSSVPYTGSTAALLGAGVFVLAAARRRLG